MKNPANPFQEKKIYTADSSFIADTYDTPADTRRIFADRLLGNSRWYFTFAYIRILLHARSLALRNRYTTDDWIASSFDIFKLIEKCGGQIHLEGMNHLRSCSGPVVLISNHMSAMDGFILPCLIAPVMNVVFVVKNGLAEHPLMGPIIKAVNSIVVKRKDPKEDLETVIQKGKELLSRGISVVVFPQSTRTVEFDPEKFNSIGIKLAKAGNVPVLPIALKTDFWGKGKFVKDLGPVHRNKPIHLIFGKAMKVTGNGKDEHRNVVEFIGKNLQRI